MTFWKPQKARHESDKIKVGPRLHIVFAVDPTQLLVGVSMGFEDDRFGHDGSEITIFLLFFDVTFYWDEGE